MPLSPCRERSARSLTPRAAGSSRREPALPLDEGGDLGDALVLLEIGKEKGAFAAHLARVPVHHLEARADQRREIDLVDDQQIRARDARPALARDLVAGGDVDDVEGDIRELRAEGRREIVAAGFDEDEIEAGEALM